MRLEVEVGSKGTQVQIMVLFFGKALTKSMKIESKPTCCVPNLPTLSNFSIGSKSIIYKSFSSSVSCINGTSDRLGQVQLHKTTQGTVAQSNAYQHLKLIGWRGRP